ncbi:MAG TPA: Rnase Y domain-containing protein [Bdellovibrionales bacterium]|nr:Rnase Y domain-containing protein [Bdellovibrionales bacterium]
MTIAIITLVTGLLLGGVLTLAALAWVRGRHRRFAEEEAKELIDSAKKDSEAAMEELKLQMEEVGEEAFGKFEKETRRLVQRNDEFEETLDEREAKGKAELLTREQALQRRQQLLHNRQQKLQSVEARVNALRERARKQTNNLLEEAKHRSSVPAETLREQIGSRFEQQVRTRVTRQAQELEQEAQLNAERDARKVLHLVLNRFARPYCPERGIGNVSFDSPEHKTRTFGADGQWIKHIEKLCGVDVVYNDQYHSATVMGFDPVRRELGRLVLEGVSKEKNPNEQAIERVHDRAKKDLFKKILVDGNRVTGELRVPNMNDAVKNMLGALRYRYSFAQNQHFHVAEVGWLCGLMSSELGLNVQDGRRAGLLHDIGKAMDHSREGGHAVIGAEFIEEHGEKPEVVHAVRAHHYDEQPSTDLAFLTIAADAVSGARPGARRSTMDSYTQKMADLEKIGSSFPGVRDTYILSAGREVRVTVDGERVDDQKALQLSKQIAQKIEDELSYPGLIKVTVVRETQAVEFAR